MLVLTSFLLLISTAFGKTVFYESFSKDFKDGDTWIVSQSADYSGEWKHSAPDDTKDFGLLVSQKAKKYAIAAQLPEAVDPKSDALLLQYDLRLQNGIECGGAYLKFLMPQEAGWTASDFKDSSPYSIMFGPDKCGSTNKVHFIFRHKSPSTGEFVEHHLKNPPSIESDKLSHVYTAVVYPNNTVEILIDGEVKQTADLLSKDFEPAVLLPETIADPEDKKPEDWDERPKIADPEAKKPEDWNEDAPRMIEDLEATKPEGWLEDEPLEIDDPEATKPADWDDDEDGEWEPSRVPNPLCKEAPGCGEWKRPKTKNPEYKGKWSAPMIDNPAYKGIWKPRDIPNPDYFHLDRPNLEPVAAVGIEIWTMTDGFLFDNILVTDDVAAGESYRSKTWKPKFDKEKAAEKAKEEEEERNRKKEERKSTKDEKPKSAVIKFKDHVFDNLHKIAALPVLKPVANQITDSLDFLESKDEYALGAISVLFSLFVVLIFSLLPGKRKPAQPSVEKAKKEDISAPDDEAEPAAEEKKEEEKEKEEPSAAGAEEVAKGGEKAEEGGEIQEEEEEEGKEQNVRRRTRRQA